MGCTLFNAKEREGELSSTNQNSEEFKLGMRVNNEGKLQNESLQS